MKHMTLIPFLCGAGASTPGCETGPTDLKTRGLASELAGAEWPEEMRDLIEDPVYGAAAQKKLGKLESDLRKKIVLHHCRYVRDKVEDVLKTGGKPVTIGGDHTMSAGSVAGLARAKRAHGQTGLIWFDTHPDMNTPESSRSGALHGMPVAALLGLGDVDMAGFGGQQGPVLRPDHVFQIGLRDIEPAEQDLMTSLGVQSLSAEEVREIGVRASFERAFSALEGNVQALAVSIDLDGFDPADAPAVGTPVDEGIRLADFLPVWRDIKAQKNIDLLEIAEYNPTLPGADITYETIKAILE